MPSNLLVERIMNKLASYVSKRPPNVVTIVALVVLASVVSATIFGIVSTLLILSALITLHEFGHWIVARISGIDVPVFAVGLGRADQATKALYGGKLRFEHRRAGETEEAGIGQHAAQGRVELAGMAAMAFVHQHENVGAVERSVARVYGRLEFLQQRGNDFRARALQQFQQVPSGIGLLGVDATGLEGAVNLVIQVNAIGHQHDFRAECSEALQQGLSQHHHGQGLAAALRAPDHEDREVSERPRDPGLERRCEEPPEDRQHRRRERPHSLGHGRQHDDNAGDRGRSIAGRHGRGWGVCGYGG